MKLRASMIIIASTLLVHSDGNMNYPAHCCGGHDCAPGKLVTSVLGDQVVTVVTTVHGSVVVPKNFGTRQSEDGRVHACMNEDKTNGGKKLLCLWLPPEA